MCILEPDPKAGGCPGNGLLSYCLTGEHATNRVIAYSLIYNENLVCSEGTRLDCYDVMFVGAHKTSILCNNMSSKCME
jgi:hypothetical protein